MYILGIMCGSSMDGADFALCEFKDNSENFKLLKSESYPYSDEIQSLLIDSPKVASDQLLYSHVKFGAYLGELVNNFVENKTCDLIALHGHTVFHEPSKGYSFQLGDLNKIHSITDIPVIGDFRNMDISNAGQGAPLVPNVEQELFPDFSVFLNLGGIANISIHASEGIIARDICIFNQALNYISKTYFDVSYDEDGLRASQGKRIENLFQELNQIPYYKTKGPASLDRLWFENNMLNMIEYFSSELPEDVLKTLVDHFAITISDYINSFNNHKQKVFISGGGVFNTYFIEILKKHLDSEVYIPQKELIEFKEAIIFASLGLKRLRNEINCKAEVTGAAKNSIGGALYGNFKSLI